MDGKTYHSNWYPYQNWASTDTLFSLQNKPIAKWPISPSEICKLSVNDLWRIYSSNIRGTSQIMSSTNKNIHNELSTKGDAYPAEPLDEETFIKVINRQKSEICSKNKKKPIYLPDNKY